MKKSVQLKDAVTSKNDQETELSSQIKLLQLEKDDLQEKMSRSVKTH